MSRLLAACALSLWIGSVLLLGELPWFRRRPLFDRLRPYSPGGLTAPGLGPGLTGSWRAVVGPWAGTAGARLARAVGVQEDITIRLRRIHASTDAPSFRIRQLGRAASGFLAGGVLATAMGRPPLPVTLLFTIGGSLLAFLLVEHQLSSASARRQRRIFLELPVVSEQLGMLLGAGYSLSAALNRLASRGTGACAEDLAVVCGRIRQGLSEVDALREWATIADVGALSRLVAILALNREAGDLGRLISEEARSIRREVQRELIEQIERRSQQVWIPVTVATLVPGAVLLAVPFVEALRLFAET